MWKKISIYGLGTFASKILVFILIPIYTRVLSTSDYGYYDVIVTDIQMLVSITFIEIWSGTLRFLLDAKELEKKYSVIKTIIILTLIGSIGYLIGVSVLGKIVLIKYPVETVMFGLIYAVFNIENGICRGIEKNVLYVISGLVSTLISCCLGILFLVVLNRTVNYLFISSIVGYLAAIVMIEIKTNNIQKAWKRKYDSKLAKRIVKFSIPLLINSIAYTCLGTYDKTKILNVLGENASGLYAVVNKFATLVNVVTSIYQLAWQEQAYILANESDKDEKYSYHMKQFMTIVGGGIPLVIWGIMLFFPILVGKEYWVSKELIPMAIMGAFVAAVSGMLSNILGAEMETKDIMVSTIVGAIINMLMIDELLKRFGVGGANISLLISFSVIAMIRYILIKRKLLFEIGRKKTGYILGVLFLMLFQLWYKNMYVLIFLGVVLSVNWILLNWNIIKDIKKIWSR